MTADYHLVTLGFELFKPPATLLMPLDTNALNALRIDRSSTPAQPERRGRLGWIIGLLALIAAAMGAFIWTKHEPTVMVTTMTVTLQRTTGGSSQSVLDASGYVVARRIATVSAKMMGQVKQVLIEEGQAVKQGDVLARLDGSTILKQHELSRQQLDASKAQLDEIRVRLDSAERTLKRAQQLRDSRLVSEADFDVASTSAAALRAQLQAAQRQVAVAEASLKVQQQNVDDLEVRAPFAGVVLSKDAQPGEIVSPMSAGGYTRTGIATIVDMESREIEVDVNEAFIHRVRDGQRAEATLDAYPDWSIPGHVINIVPTADRAKATVKVRIGFDRLDPRILPDMSIKVRFLDDAPETTAAEQAILVPSTAVVLDDKKPYVWMVRSQHLERIAIRTGQLRGSQIAVEAGVHPGDVLVTQPLSTFREGMKVGISTP